MKVNKRLKKWAALMLCVIIFLSAFSPGTQSVYASEEQSGQMLTEKQDVASDVAEEMKPIEKTTEEKSEGSQNQQLPDSSNEETGTTEGVEKDQSTKEQDTKEQDTEDLNTKEQDTENQTTEVQDTKDQTTKEPGKKDQDTKEKKIAELLAEAAVPKAATIISEDRDEGIRQIQAVIPDYNFATGVYDSLASQGHLGTVGQSVKAVLASFQGDVNANGYVKKTTYMVTATKITLEPYSEVKISETFETKEEAQTFFDSLVNKLPDYLYSNKELTTKLTQTNEQKPEAELIKDITGIEWLREANKIDISYNKIEDLSKLSIDYLKNLTPEVGNMDITEGMTWFGTKGKNTYLDFRGNPIQAYPSETGGRLLWESLQAANFELPVAPQIYIKPDTKDWSINLDINIPLVNVDGNRMNIIIGNPKQAFIDKEKSNIPGILLNMDRLDNIIFPVTGIISSGTIAAVVTGADEMRSWAVPPGTDNPSIGGTSLKFLFNQSIRIYTKTETEPSTNNTTITLKKTVTGTDRPVTGAKFKLYHATLENGKYVKGGLYNDTEYMTDEKGQIQFTTELPSGHYCFVEVESPAGFVLDSETTIGFTVAGGTVSLTGGESTVTPSNGTATDAGENAAYIDRYSPDVNVVITPEEGCELDKVMITYFDRGTQTNKTHEVKTAQEAADWINQNKGNADELGIIDGTVKIKAIFKQSIPLTAQNERTTTVFQFKKISAEDGSLMAGVEFSFTCNHKHDEICGGKENPVNCTHAHNDVPGNVNENECTWKTAAVSGADGIVSFPGLVSGEYILKEEKTLDGFSLPGGTWTVTVNADAGTVEIMKTTADDDTTPDFNKEGNGYVLENQSTVPFSFKKVDEKTGAALSGAEFTLYQGTTESPENWTVVMGPIASDENGKVDFGRLKQGDYILVETKAAASYQKPAGYWKVKITVTDNTNEKVKFEAVGDVPAIKGDFMDGFEIENRKIDILPNLGGSGTIMYSAGGILLIGCSIILNYIYRRKRGTNL